MGISRRFFLVLPLALRAADTAFRGTLVAGPGLRLADGTVITLTGDADTVPVLKDKRVANSDFEVIGTRAGNKVTIRPIHEPSLFLYKDGKRLRVTYWCDVCAIRTYTPGLCWCCREETELDPREPDTVDKK
ncbi:MAG TPA: hypothetical protein VES20_01495 [Bryobacteraceae bacterium]|nr:hypothetical protein [Bryobacteraceae bacterium]